MDTFQYPVPPISLKGNDNSPPRPLPPAFLEGAEGEPPPWIKTRLVVPKADRINGLAHSLADKPRARAAGNRPAPHRQSEHNLPEPRNQLCHKPELERTREAAGPFGARSCAHNTGGRRNGIRWEN